MISSLNLYTLDKFLDVINDLENEDLKKDAFSNFLENYVLDKEAVIKVYPYLTKEFVSSHKYLSKEIVDQFPELFDAGVYLDTVKHFKGNPILLIYDTVRSKLSIDGDTALNLITAYPRISDHFIEEVYKCEKISFIRAILSRMFFSKDETRAIKDSLYEKYGNELLNTKDLLEKGKTMSDDEIMSVFKNNLSLKTFLIALKYIKKESTISEILSIAESIPEVSAESGFDESLGIPTELLNSPQFRKHIPAILDICYRKSYAQHVALEKVSFSQSLSSLKAFLFMFLRLYKIEDQEACMLKDLLRRTIPYRNLVSMATKYKLKAFSMLIAFETDLGDEMEDFV